MKIDVVPFADALAQVDLTGKTVVVIDILRATSVMVTALHNGAHQIIPCLTVDSAVKKAEEFREGEYLLCGEQDAEKIEGFHLGNSPLQFTPEVISGKVIIQTTSNGTKALHACRGAEEILIGSFLNLASVSRRLTQKEKIVLACSGTLGKFSIDDAMAAAAIIDELSKHSQPRLNDLGQAVLMAYQSKNGNLSELLNDCFHLNYLRKKGFEKDIDFCLTKNAFDILPCLNQQTGIILPLE